MERVFPESGSRITRELFQAEVENLRERVRRGGPDFVDGYRPRQLALHGGERGALDPTGGDPLGEGRRVEVDVQRVAVRRHPLVDVDADARDLARRAVQPDTREA